MEGSYERFIMTEHIAILKRDLACRGGLEKYTYQLAQYFAQQGKQVSLVAMKPPESPLPKGVVLHLIGNPSKSSLWDVLRYDRLCRHWVDQHRPDIVFGLDRTAQQTHYRAGNGVHATFLDQRRLVESTWKALSFRFNPMHKRFLAIERATFENPSLQCLIANSSMVAEDIRSRFNISEEKVQVVHNGVEWHDWQSHFDLWPQERPRLMEQLHLDPTQHQLLFIGHGYRRKGLEPLLYGLAKVKSYPFQLSVVGKDRELPRFRALTERLGLQDKVRFLGPLANPVPLYQIADTLLIPSLYDPFANVTLEALAMGLYVATSSWNGGKEILTPSNGVVWENLLDPESIASGIKKSLENPKTVQRAHEIRQSIRHLDFSFQLDKIFRLVTKAS